MPFLMLWITCPVYNEPEPLTVSLKNGENVKFKKIKNTYSDFEVSTGSYKQ